MIMKKDNLLPTAIACVIGLAGLLLVLYAWHLPPFRPSAATTENAYLRSEVTTISPQVSGYIKEVKVKDYQEVKAGDVIAVIDDRSATIKLSQAQASLSAAEAAINVAEQNVVSAGLQEQAAAANLESAEVQLATTRKDSERVAALKERGVLTAAENDQAVLALQKAEAQVHYAKAQFDAQAQLVITARAQVETARAQKEAATSALNLAQLDLDNTIIRAPKDGHLGQVTARVGQYATAGTGLVSHIGQDIWLIANFNESEMAKIVLGDKAQFTIDAIPNVEFSGVVESFSPATASEFSLTSGTNATGNFTKISQRVPVKIRFEMNQPGAERLAAGYSAIVVISND